MSYVGIALLMTTGDLDMALDLNYLLSCLVDDPWDTALDLNYLLGCLVDTTLNLNYLSPTSAQQI
nr:hypothetical protein [Tanacetum cinerariifolium]